MDLIKELLQLSEDTSSDLSKKIAGVVDTEVAKAMSGKSLPTPNQVLPKIKAKLKSMGVADADHNKAIDDAVNTHLNDEGEKNKDFASYWDNMASSFHG